MLRSSTCIRSDPVALSVPLDHNSSKDPVISPFRGDSKRTFCKRRVYWPARLPVSVKIPSAATDPETV